MGELNNILTGFDTLFRLITGANGYQQTIGQVDRNFVFDEKKKFNAILVVAAFAPYEEKTSNMSDILKPFNCYGYFYNPIALQSEAVKMLEDMTRAIGKNNDEGITDYYVHILGAGPAADVFQGGYGYAPGFVHPYGCVLVATEVKYRINNAEGG